MWWQRDAKEVRQLLDATWLQQPLQDPACLVTVRRARDQRLVFVSSQATDLLGYAPERLEGRPMTDLVLPVDLADAAPLLAAGSDKLSASIVRLRCKTGERWFRTVCVPVDEHVITLQHEAPAPATGCCHAIAADGLSLRAAMHVLASP